jgi:hypothetical protein
VYLEIVILLSIYLFCWIHFFLNFYRHLSRASHLFICVVFILAFLLWMGKIWDQLDFCSLKNHHFFTPEFLHTLFQTERSLFFSYRFNQSFTWGNFLYVTHFVITFVHFYLYVSIFHRLELTSSAWNILFLDIFICFYLSLEWVEGLLSDFFHHSISLGVTSDFCYQHFLEFLNSNKIEIRDQWLLVQGVPLLYIIFNCKGGGGGRGEKW